MPTRPATRRTSTKLIKGQEDYVYVWTLGVEGVGDGSDKLVTIDVNPKSKSYGKVVHTLSVGGRGEAHHMGFTDDRATSGRAASTTSKIYVFDVGTDPAKPKLVRTITDLPQKTGFVGPHTFYALPGRMLIQALSNTKDHGGVTGMAVYNNNGEFVATYAMPTGEVGGAKGDGYGYDLAINPAKNVLLTSSFTGWNNYMMDIGKLVPIAEAMKRFGNTMVAWDLKAMKPKKVFSVPGAPLEIRWSLNPKRQLGGHRHGAHLQALARQARRQGRLAGQGRRHDRRSRQDPAAGGHQHHRATARACGSTPSWTA